MVKYVIAIIFSLGIMSSSMAQTEDSLQAVQENEMVCFLTDANTITCFVAPEGSSNPGMIGPDTTTPQNQNPFEQDQSQGTFEEDTLGGQNQEPYNYDGPPSDEEQMFERNDTLSNEPKETEVKLYGS